MNFIYRYKDKDYTEFPETELDRHEFLKGKYKEFELKVKKFNGDCFVTLGENENKYYNIYELEPMTTVDYPTIREIFQSILPDEPTLGSDSL